MGIIVWDMIHVDYYALLFALLMQLPSLGVESSLWLVASGDRRVSIWTSEWRRDSGCQLVDWLTFAGPAFAPDGTRLKKADKVRLVRALLHLQK